MAVRSIVCIQNHVKLLAGKVRKGIPYLTSVDIVHGIHVHKQACESDGLLRLSHNGN